MSRVIIEMTPFIFEDRNTYYFKIFKRPSTNDYHDLFVYEKVNYKTWYGTTKSKYVQLNNSAELVGVKLDSIDVKNRIKKVLIGTKASHKIANWDGFVGNIPDDIKKSLSRNNRLDDLGV